MHRNVPGSNLSSFRTAASNQSRPSTHHPTSTYSRNHNHKNKMNSPTTTVCSPSVKPNINIVNQYHAVHNEIFKAVNWCYDIQSPELYKEFTHFLINDGVIAPQLSFSNLSSSSEKSVRTLKPPNSGSQKSHRIQPNDGSDQSSSLRSSHSVHRYQHQEQLSYFFICLIIIVVFFAFPVTTYYYSLWLFMWKPPSFGTNNTLTSQFYLVFGLTQLIGLLLISLLGIYLLFIHFKHSMCARNSHQSPHMQPNFPVGGASRSGKTTTSMMATVCTGSGNSRSCCSNLFNQTSNKSIMVKRVVPANRTDIEEGTRDTEPSPLKPHNFSDSNGEYGTCLSRNVMERYLCFWYCVDTFRKCQFCFLTYAQLIYCLYFIQMIVMMKINNGFYIPWLPRDTNHVVHSKDTLLVFHGMVLLLCPFAQSMAFPGVSMQSSLFNLLLMFALVLIGGIVIVEYRCVIVLLMIAVLACSMMIDQQRTRLRAFFSMHQLHQQYEMDLNNRLTKEIESNKTIESKYVLEMKHMISNVAHDLKTVSSSKLRGIKYTNGFICFFLNSLFRHSFQGSISFISLFKIVVNQQHL